MSIPDTPSSQEPRRWVSAMGRSDDRTATQAVGVPKVAHRDREAHAFLTLSSIRGVGHKTLLDLAEAGHSFADVLKPGHLERCRSRGDQAPNPTRRSWTGRPLRAEASDRMARIGDLLRSMGVQLIFRDDPRIPAVAARSRAAAALAVHSRVARRAQPCRR